ncbi:lysoplasmalogenase [Nocardiopsis flavescens]
MIPRETLPRLFLALFILVSVVHLAVQAVGAEAWSRPTQALLMPLLAAFAWTAAPRPRGRLVRLTAVALFFSWLGDTAPALASQDTAFLVMVGFFAVAQAVYITAFAPWWGRSPLRSNRTLLVPYAVVVAGLVALCAPGAGPLLVPVLVYGLLLGAMAVLAVGVHRWAAVGGALFLLSDGLIALRAFSPGFDLPLSGFWVMLAYTAAQALIVLGALARDRAPAGEAPA